MCIYVFFGCFVSVCGHQVSTTLCTVRRRAGRSRRWLRPAEEEWWAASRAAATPHPQPWSCCSSRAISTMENHLLWDITHFTATSTLQLTASHIFVTQHRSDVSWSDIPACKSYRLNAWHVTDAISLNHFYYKWFIWYRAYISYTAN